MGGIIDDDVSNGQPNERKGDQSQHGEADRAYDSAQRAGAGGQGDEMKRRRKARGVMHEAPPEQRLRQWWISQPWAETGTSASLVDVFSLYSLG